VSRKTALIISGSLNIIGVKRTKDRTFISGNSFANTMYKPTYCAKKKARAIETIVMITPVFVYFDFERS